MAITVHKLNGKTMMIEPSFRTCKEAILNEGLHTGPEDIRVTCGNKYVDDELATDYDGRQLTIRVRMGGFTEASAYNPFKKENYFMNKQENRMPLENEISHVTKQQEFREVLQQNQEEISERVRGYFDRKIGLIERFYPGEFQKAIEDGKLRKAKSELEFDHNLMRLSIRFKLDAIEERYQTWLKVIKVNYREQFYSFVTHKVNLLQQSMFEREQEFFGLMRRRYLLIEANQDMPIMVEAYRQKIEKEQEKYFGWLEYIMDDFQNIVKEKIKTYDD